MSEHWYLYIIAVAAMGYAFLKYSQRNDKPVPEPQPKKKL